MNKFIDFKVLSIAILLYLLCIFLAPIVLVFFILSVQGIFGFRDTSVVAYEVLFEYMIMYLSILFASYVLSKNSNRNRELFIFTIIVFTYSFSGTISEIGSLTYSQLLKFTIGDIVIIPFILLGRFIALKRKK